MITMEYNRVIQDCAEMFDSLNLTMNLKKTKELVITAVEEPPAAEPIFLNNTPLETVSQFNYLGTIITNSIDFNINSISRINKAKYKLYLMRKLAYAKADIRVINTTYTSYV